MSQDPVSKTQAWLRAARPRTLPVAAAPVAVGTAVAAAQGSARALPALAALSGALLLQLASNFANDLFDFEKGADTEARIGPPRVTQLGLLSPQQMRTGIGVVLVLAAGVGCYLVAVAGWPIVAIGLLSMAAALAYTGGPWPFGYKGLGDLAVFLFFGVIAVTGTEYVQSGHFSIQAFWASIPVGALATAILVVNNVRDVDTDRAAGKRTPVVRMGRAGGVAEYGLLLLVAYVSPLFFWLALGRSALILLPLLTSPVAISLYRTVARETSGPPLNAALARTARLSLFYALLLALGWWL